MLEIIIVFTFYAFLQKIVDIPFIRIIRKSNTAEEAIKHRKQLKTMRAVLFAVFLVGYVICGLALNNERWKIAPLSTLRDCFMWFFLMFFYLYIMRRYAVFRGNISIFGKDDYLNKHNRFALFLREFENDMYFKRKRISEQKKQLRFSEYWFMYVLQKRIHACAIGMTKEYDSPYGAQRIYVNDESWKEDVSELMGKADVIYVLVNDRPSCIWEIAQTKHIQDKTVYIVDDIEKYNNVKNLVGTELCLPDIPKEMLICDKHFYITCYNREFLVRPYENTVEGYCKLLEFDDRIIQKRIEMSNLKQKGWRRFFELQLLLLFWVSVIPFGLWLAFNSNKNNVFLGVIVVFLLSSFIVLYGLFKKIKAIKKAKRL